MKAGKSDKEIIAFLTERYGAVHSLSSASDADHLPACGLGHLCCCSPGCAVLFRYIKQRRDMIAEQPLSSEERRRAEELVAHRLRKGDGVILFWVICIAMLVRARCFLCCRRRCAPDASKTKDENARRNANIAVYRDQLNELEADLRNGIVSQEQYAQDRDDIERRLLEDTATNRYSEKSAARSARRAQACVHDRRRIALWWP